MQKIIKTLSILLLFSFPYALHARGGQNHKRKNRIRTTSYPLLAHTASQTNHPALPDDLRNDINNHHHVLNISALDELENDRPKNIKVDFLREKTMIAYSNTIRAVHIPLAVDQSKLDNHDANIASKELLTYNENHALELEETITTLTTKLTALRPLLTLKDSASDITEGTVSTITTDDIPATPAPSPANFSSAKNNSEKAIKKGWFSWGSSKK